MRRLLLVPLAFACASCNLLQVASWGQRSPLFTTPTIDVGQPALTSSPSIDAVARWYCPDLIGSGGELACSALLGPSPSDTELTFVFSTPLDVGNPNAFPLPALEALVALTLFPEGTDRTLGAACLSFCGTDDATCASLPDAGTCASSEPDLRSIDDFAAAALHVLVGVATGDAPALSVPTIEADGSRRLTLALSVDAGTLLELLAGEAADRWQAYVAGEAVSLSIPYQLDGTLWFVVEGLGRVGFPFGPVSGEWKIQ